MWARILGVLRERFLPLSLAWKIASEVFSCGSWLELAVENHFLVAATGTISSCDCSLLTRKDTFFIHRHISISKQRLSQGILMVVVMIVVVVMDHHSIIIIEPSQNKNGW